MQIAFHVEPEKGYLQAKVIISATEIQGLPFYLNRDFEVEEILCDGVATPIHKTTYDSDCYEVAQYLLPDCGTEFQISYQGTLSGSTGTCPYAKETISPDFTFLRVETFCYPIFAKDHQNGIREFLDGHLDIRAHITVPSQYLVVSTGKNLECQSHSTYTTWTESIHTNNFAISIAKYVKTTLTQGVFYFLNARNYTPLLEETLTEASQYMNTHFGEKVIQSDMRYVTIPSGLGSFTLDYAVFIEESAYESIQSLEQLVHEFIHTGWNAKTDLITQKIRFFDEAFTSYFTLRVMEHILPTDAYQTLLQGYKNSETYLLQYLRDDIPIAQYGDYDYGSLSYTTGAFCLVALCHKLGQDLFDQVTTLFLEKYKDTPADLATFCHEYLTLSGRDDLEKFFDDWIYTTNFRSNPAYRINA